MNGQWLGSRSIRTNWATRKPPASKAERKFFFFSILFSFVVQIIILNGVYLKIYKHV